MAADQVALLEGIARKFRTKVRSVNLHVSGFCATPLDPKEPWKIPQPNDWFHRQTSLTRNRRTIRLYASRKYLRAKVGGHFMPRICSINRPDYWSLSNRPIARFATLPVYAAKMDASLKSLLGSKPLERTLGKLELKPKESVVISQDCLELFLQRQSTSEVMSALAIACTFANQLPARREKRSLSALPQEFKTLQRLIRKWGVSDDDERNEIVQGASRPALKRLVGCVEPHLSAIDEYLDSFKAEPLSDAAIALGALAECVLEARAYLKAERGKS
jgi:hypothetical protein